MRRDGAPTRSGQGGLNWLVRRFGMPILLLVAGFLFVYPVAMLVVGAFRNTDPSFPAEWSFRAFTLAYTDPATYETIKNSIILSASVTVVATALGIMFAFLVTRTNTPLRGLVTAMMVLVVAFPPLFFTLGWALLGRPRVGLINRVASALAGSDVTVINVNSWFGLVLVIALKAASFGYLLLLGPFRAMDRSVEEASRTAGAGRLATFLRIDLPILAPAITGVLILSFIVGLEIFETPLILGIPAGIHVFATQIYGLINNHTPPEYGGASALSLLLVALVIGLVVLQWRVLGRRQFTTVTGKGSRTQPWDIGPWRYVGAALIAGYAMLALVLPILQLVLGSLQPIFGWYSSLTLDNYRTALLDPTFGVAIRSTLLVSVVGGFIAMSVAMLIAYAIRHSTSVLRRPLELSTWLPWAVPGVVLSLGMAWAYLSLPGLRGLFGTVWIVMLGLVVAAIPIASRAVAPALAQLTSELEESARVSGATPVRTFFGVVLPIIAPSFLTGWFITAILISGNLAIPILLSGPGNQTVPILVFNLYDSGEAAQAAAVFVVILGALTLGLAVLMLISRLLRRRCGQRLATTPPATPAPPAGAGQPPAAAASRPAVMTTSEES